MHSTCGEACVPCEKFSRNTFTPARISEASVSREAEAGPRVATILVWRRGGESWSVTVVSEVR